VDFLSEEENFSVIQLLSPYIIRYFSVSLILNKSLHKNRKFDLYNLIEAIRRKVFKQQDPFVDFLSTLQIDFDFESAKNKIQLIQ